MKLRVAAKIVITIALAVCASAQTAATAVDNSGPTELAHFKKFIAEHPKALAELQRDPSLIFSADFAKRHRRVGEYIAKHPKVKDELKANPTALAELKPTREGGQNRYGHKREDEQKK